MATAASLTKEKKEKVVNRMIGKLTAKSTKNSVESLRQEPTPNQDLPNKCPVCLEMLARSFP